MSERYIICPPKVWTHVEETNTDVINESDVNKAITVFDSTEGHKKIMFNDAGVWGMHMCNGACNGS